MGKKCFARTPAEALIVCRVMARRKAVPIPMGRSLLGFVGSLLVESLPTVSIKFTVEEAGGKILEKMATRDVGVVRQGSVDEVVEEVREPRVLDWGKVLAVQVQEEERYLCHLSFFSPS